MPSVKDFLNFKTTFSRMDKGSRNQCITDTIAWLETEERPKYQGDTLSALINLENHFQSALNLNKVPDTWFTTFQFTYASFPFMDKVLRRFR